MQHRKAPKSVGSTEPISPVLPGIFPVWVLFGSNQISKNSIHQKSDEKQEKAPGFPKKPEGRWSECRDSSPGPLGPEDSAGKSGGCFPPRLVLFVPAESAFQTSPLQCLRTLPTQSGSLFGSDRNPSPSNGLQKSTGIIRSVHGGGTFLRDTQHLS